MQDGIEHPTTTTTSESECPIESVTEDGVLCSILSKLTLREAVRTSVLSSRWRSLWKHIPYLDFSAHSMMEPYAKDYSYLLTLDFSEQKLILGPRAEWFVRSVDNVLRHRPAVGVKYFGVRFRLLKEHTPYINRWLSFAIDSGAQVLVFDFFEANFQFTVLEEWYEFPCQLFSSGSGRGSSLERLYVTYCTFRLPEQFTGFASLKELGLANLYISDMDINNILSACSNLQHMHLFRCYSLDSLYISQPSGQMKSLVVHDCNMLKLIEFSGISLKMFDYRGHRIPYTFTNAAQVMGLCIKIKEKGCRYFLTDLPKDFGHLGKVHLFALGPIEAARIPASYEFPHLKHLEMSLKISSKDDFITLAFILNAAPLVETFHLKDGIEHPTMTSESECPIESVREDGILCSILSKLTLREAVRTSVLSSRWRSLWKHIPYLDLNAHSMMEPYAEDYSYLLSLDFSEQKLILGPRADWFVRSVDDVLRHRPAVGVKYFGVRFRLLKEHTPYMNRWLSFAIDSGAQLLIFYFFETNFEFYEQEEQYEFPCQLFSSGSGRGRGSSLERLYVTYCTFRLLDQQFTGFASPKELGLANLYISDTDIKNILSACSNLQHKHLFRCYCLASLYISQPFGQMKSLVVHDCSKLKQIEFSGMSLKMFNYRGHWVAYTFMNAARVVGLSIIIYITGCGYLLTDLPIDFRHLEKLLLFALGPIEAARIPASYKFPHLKHLEMSLDISSKTSSHWHSF